MNLKNCIAAAALMLFAASVVAQVTSPSPITNPSASKLVQITAADGSVVSLSPDSNLTLTTRPNNAPGGVVSMPPSTAFYVNYLDFMKPKRGWSTLRIEFATAGGDGQRPTLSNGGNFRVDCYTSHMGRFDPIVYPGTKQAGHLHTFFGNSSVTGLLDQTTLGNLANFGESTCAGGIANRSGYWIPALIDITSGKAISPRGNNVYYKNGGTWRAANITAVQAPPPGLHFIAGNPLSTVEQGAVRWLCTGGGAQTVGVNGFQRIMTAADLAANPGFCSETGNLQKDVFFQQCWDGVNLDSPDHQSHVAYEDFNTGCPSTHPVVLPQIQYNIAWSIKSLGGVANIPNLRLSSDNYPLSQPGGLSGHGDWVNGWNPTIMNMIVSRCLRTSTDCHNRVIDKFGTWEATGQYRTLF